MPTKNIFAGLGVKTTFVNILYNELMKREYISLADIMCIKRGYPKGFYDNNPKKTLSKEKYYGDLKKASSELIRVLEQVCSGCIKDNGKTGKGKAFKYIGKNDNPLAEERKAVIQKSVEDYIEFCKNTAGLLPPSWFSAFFENTQLLLDTNRDAESGTTHIRSSLEQNLTNIHLLPVLYKAITNHCVLQFFYHPFGQKVFTLTFHPQFLKEYNGRWFNDIRAYNIIRGQVAGAVPAATPFPQQQATAASDAATSPFPPAQEPAGEGAADDLPF